MSKNPLKSGEKVLFVISGVFALLGVIAYVALETIRISSDKPIFSQTTHWNFSEDGKLGSKLYREANCNACHRAMKSGTSMGLSLDGLGSKYSASHIEAFLRDPERFYNGPTLDHGDAPKEAAYAAKLPDESIRLIAIFLSELKADPGSSVAKVPPPGRSEFIDSMVRIWAPEDWKERFSDLRERPPAESTPAESAEGNAR